MGNIRGEDHSTRTNRELTTSEVTAAVVGPRRCDWRLFGSSGGLARAQNDDQLLHLNEWRPDSNGSAASTAIARARMRTSGSVTVELRRRGSTSTAERAVAPFGAGLEVLDDVPLDSRVNGVMIHLRPKNAARH